MFFHLSIQILKNIFQNKILEINFKTKIKNKYFTLFKTYTSFNLFTSRYTCYLILSTHIYQCMFFHLSIQILKNIFQNKILEINFKTKIKNKYFTLFKTYTSFNLFTSRYTCYLILSTHIYHCMFFHLSIQLVKHII